MAIVKSEFALALNQVATERGISPDDVVVSIEAAILAAFHKEYPDQAEDEEITVKISKANGETKILKNEEDITPPGFGRIAAQTARQVILQKIREAEKKTVISHYKEQVASLVKGRIIRYDGYNAYVDIGKAEAVLPKEEQIRNEKYTVNDTLLFYLKDIAEDKFGHTRIVLSRSDSQLIAELFKREVPEISSGTVEIKKIVREPGERAKIAVFSSHGGVDPVGACVGQKGVRVQTVTDELGGQEKIDIIQWNKDSKIFLIAALSPAKINNVEINETTRSAQVVVDESQAPLAIGKNGINVNLASRLAEYQIDIVQIASAEPVTEEAKEEEVSA
ncbi:transcription termination factor NusA [Candidatus Roizmanbacteria bacterium]|nr:transcription termination factor NusA [Candidatus Roizmanbacteria bacterium]